MRYFDASRIVLISKAVLEGHVELWVDTGGADGPSVFMTDSYDEGGLVELVMQARMNPAEFMPSRYVGKGEEAEPTSTGSLRWKANPERKK
jgi:hypothetical protein